jgi:hypothetical protein
MHIVYTKKFFIFLNKKLFFFYNFINFFFFFFFFFLQDNIWCLYIITKIPIIFICMKIFQHFCDVFVPYYKIVSFNFYYHISNITLYGILFQKKFVGQYFISIQANYDLKVSNNITSSIDQH